MRWVDKYKYTNNITLNKGDYKAYKNTNSYSNIDSPFRYNYINLTLDR